MANDSLIAARHPEGDVATPTEYAGDIGELAAAVGTAAAHQLDEALEFLIGALLGRGQAADVLADFAKFGLGELLGSGHLVHHLHACKDQLPDGDKALVKLFLALFQAPHPPFRALPSLFRLLP